MSYNRCFPQLSFLIHDLLPDFSCPQLSWLIAWFQHEYPFGYHYWSKNYWIFRTNHLSAVPVCFAIVFWDKSCFVNHFLLLFYYVHLSIGQYIVCLSSSYDFWLLLWSLQTYLTFKMIYDSVILDWLKTSLDCIVL